MSIKLLSVRFIRHFLTLSYRDSMVVAVESNIILVFASRRIQECILIAVPTTQAIGKTYKKVEEPGPVTYNMRLVHRVFTLSTSHIATENVAKDSNVRNFFIWRFRLAIKIR